MLLHRAHWLAVLVGLTILSPGGVTRAATEPRPVACAEHLPASPEHPPATASSLPSRELIQDLFGWIGDNTNYDVSEALAQPPTISLCDNGSTLIYEGHPVLVDKPLRGAYDMQARHIFLVRPWSADDPHHVGSLLHELVHHVQWTRRTWTCMYEPEWQAYKLQDKWLTQQGIDAGFDWLFIFAISRCQPNVHPGLEKAPD